MSEKRRKYELKLILILSALTVLFIVLTLIGGKVFAEKTDPALDYSTINHEGVVKHVSYSGVYGEYNLSYKDTKWYCDEDPALEMDSSEIGIVTMTLKTAEPSRVLSGVADQYEKWGLSEGKADKITITIDGENYTYYIGAYNSVTKCFFMRCDNEPDKAYMLSKVRASMADQPLSALVVSDEEKESSALAASEEEAEAKEDSEA